MNDMVKHGEYNTFDLESSLVLNGVAQNFWRTKERMISRAGLTRILGN